MPLGSISTPDSDSSTRSGRCARYAATNKPGRHRHAARAATGAGWRMDLQIMATARAVLAFALLLGGSGVASAQTGPSDPQVIARAGTAKIQLGNRKLAGH